MEDGGGAELPQEAWRGHHRGHGRTAQIHPLRTEIGEEEGITLKQGCILYNLAKFFIVGISRHKDFVM